MGAQRFERQPPVAGSNKNVIEFDSSYDRAIALAFGWELGSVELREISRTSSQIDYDVFARNYRANPEDPEKPLQRRGVLKSVVPDEIIRRQDAGVYHGRYHH